MAGSIGNLSDGTELLNAGAAAAWRRRCHDACRKSLQAYKRSCAATEKQKGGPGAALHSEPWYRVLG